MADPIGVIDKPRVRILVLGNILSTVSITFTISNASTFSTTFTISITSVVSSHGGHA